MVVEARHILCYVSVADGYSDAVHRAAQLASGNGATLTLVGVVEPIARLLTSFLGSAKTIETMLAKQLTDELDELVARLSGEGIDARRTVRFGAPDKEIIQEVRDSGCDLVVKLAQGRDGRMLGDTALHLVRSCPAPVWIVKPGPRERRRVAAAVDPQGDTELAQRILRTARQAARSLDARLDVIHAWDVLAAHLLESRMASDEFAALLGGVRDDARARLADLLSSVPGALDDEHASVVQGHHGHVLLDYLTREGVDLLVLGTLSRSGLAGFVIGNTAEVVLDRVDCSVLVLKPQGFGGDATSSA